MGYYYKLYYDSLLLIDSLDRDEFYETEEEAREEAEDDRDQQIELWKIDDAWNEDDSLDYFDIIIEEK